MMASEQEIIEKLFEIQEKGGEQDVDFVIEVLYAGETRAVREMAIDTLIELGKRYPIAQKIAQLLRSDDAFTRNSAIEILSRIKSEETLRILEKLVKDPDKEVRKYALDALGKMEGNGEVDKIIMIALDDKDPNVKFAACEYLGARRCKDAQDKLIRLLEKEQSEYGVSVLLDVLTQLESKKALEVIKKRYKDFQNSEIAISFFKAISVISGQLLCEDLQKFANVYPEEVIDTLRQVQKIPCPAEVEKFILNLDEGKIFAFAEEILDIAGKTGSSAILEKVALAVPDDESIYPLLEKFEEVAEKTGVSEKLVEELLEKGDVPKKILGLRLAPFSPSRKIAELITKLVLSPENEEISSECARALSKFPAQHLPPNLKDVYVKLPENERAMLLSAETAKVIGTDILLKDFETTKDVKLKYKIMRVCPLPPEKIKEIAEKGQEPLRTLARRFLETRGGGRL